MTQSVERWARELINLDARNTLLNFRDTKTGTLDLTEADPQALASLFTGATISLSQLFRSPDRHAEACGRIRNIRRKILALEEEQGIEAGQLARGLLLVDPPQTRGTKPVVPLRAPLLIRQLEIRSRTAAQTEFTLEAGEDVEPNHVLLHALHREYGMAVDIDDLGDKLAASVAELTEPDDQVDVVYRVLAETCALFGLALTLERRVVVGVFGYAKLPMVKDLRNSIELLAGNEVVCALANDQSARAVVHARNAQIHPVEPDDMSPRDEFLVCDADSSQQRAVHVALAGGDLVIEGPPGTGKSQTIANIIAGAAAKGLRVLFVAEKRAAIEAVTSRLARVGLDGLVFDLHHQKLSKRAVAARLGENLRRASNELPPQVPSLHDLTRRRAELVGYTQALHGVRPPWGCSAYEIQSRLLELPANCRNDVRFPRQCLHHLAGGTLAVVRRDVERFVELDGLRFRRGGSAWSNAEIDDDDVRRVLVELHELTQSTWPITTAELNDLVRRIGIAPASDLAGWQQILGLLNGVAATIRVFGPNAFSGNLDELFLATGPRQWRRRQPAGRDLGWWYRRGLRKQASTLCGGRLRRADLHTELRHAVVRRNHWWYLSQGHSQPMEVPNLDARIEQFARLRDQLASIALSARLANVDHWPADELQSRLGELREDRDIVFNIPELRRLTTGLEHIGMRELLDELTRRNATGTHALQILDWSWLYSLLDELRVQDARLREFTSDWHCRKIDEFRRFDVDHRGFASPRVRYAVAKRLRQIKDLHPEQAMLVKREAEKKTRHRPLKRLVQGAPDVLLALHPCWAMSPLIVSQTLPASQLFDLVIFDEASQIEPQEAITSIMRGRRLVVAGDDQQLPPTRFFNRVVEQLDELGEDEDEEITDYESVLKVLKGFLPCRTLRWHYRSQDERLIAFSNEHFYGNNLVTFPGVMERPPVRLETVAGFAGPGKGSSSPAEVERVVELVLEHAERQPDTSLGVITLGLPHRDRIQRALDRALADRQHLAEFFSAEKGVSVRFFVKNLEQVQGDERGSIILSIGKAKRPNGTLDRNFGALNKEGGRRRLNVAVTRARQEFLVVSSFGPADLGVSDNDGVETLRRYLEFAATGGELHRVGRATGSELNGFERSVLEALRRTGLNPYPQWGVSGYRIDFAIPHRDQPGRMVLAVETDGDRYHRCGSARDRDRLRQQHLELLGWRFHRIWSSAWFRDPERETARVVEAWQRAMAEFDQPPATGAAPPPVPAQPAVARPRGPRPNVPPGLDIAEYSVVQLVSLFRWLLGDGRQLDREERVRQAQQELGYERLGTVRRQRLTEAFDIAQGQADREEL